MDDQCKRTTQELRVERVNLPSSCQEDQSHLKDRSYARSTHPSQYPRWWNGQCPHHIPCLSPTREGEEERLGLGRSWGPFPLHDGEDQQLLSVHLNKQTFYQHPYPTIERQKGTSSSWKHEELRPMSPHLRLSGPLQLSWFPPAYSLPLAYSLMIPSLKQTCVLESTWVQSKAKGVW